MPRLKAMTTGSVPSFLDMILNFAEGDTTSSLATQDTWLAQMKAKQQGRLVLYGDDTWLKLFPDTFDRADGTSSFFVSDFTEVDNNVTRHVSHELAQDDWNVMILHYLGLDHIGHKTGPRSPNMLPKQREMDGIVRQIYNAMDSISHLNSTLLVLCGDHGMNALGNHGGSAPGETSPALVFVSSKLKSISKGFKAPTAPEKDFDYYDKVEQSDIAPTLAGLLGFPVPLNNLGIFIPDFLSFWPIEQDRMQLMLRNALQIKEIVKATFPSPAWDETSKVQVDCKGSLSTGNSLLCLWREVTKNLFPADGNIAAGNVVMPMLTHFCKEAQVALSSTASNYNILRLYNGALLALCAAILSFSVFLPCLRRCQLPSTWWFLLTTVLYVISMFASSYVEEEKHFWNWSINGWLLIDSIRSSASKVPVSLKILALHRIAQAMSDSPMPAPLLIISVLATYLYTGHEIYRRSYLTSMLKSEASAFGSSLLTAIAFLFKLTFTYYDEPRLLGKPEIVTSFFSWLTHINLNTLARLTFCLALISVVYLIGARTVGPRRLIHSHRGREAGLLDAILPILILILITQTRVERIPLFLVFQSIYKQVERECRTPLYIILVTNALAYASFFLLGGSNSINTIDLANAYNGVSGFNIGLVGFLLFLSNWAGPIYWSLSGTALLLSWTESQPYLKGNHSRLTGAPTADMTEKQLDRNVVVLKRQVWFLQATMLTFFTAAGLAGVMAACVVLRTHLFVWTVFSPKYLFGVAWAICWHIFINIVVCGLSVLGG